MIQKRIVCAKLSQLRGRQQTLKDLAVEPVERFVSDPVKVSAAERLLQVSIEVCLDLGHHLIAGLALPRPAEYRDVFRILGDHGILTREFASQLEEMAAFRNRLVHVYAEVSPAKVYEFLRDRRSDFDAFARAIATYVKQLDEG